MRPLAVDLVLLRQAAPDLPLVLGRSLMARVVERHGPQLGIINLAGAYLTAELPSHLQAGDRLRLVVRELTPDRLVLQLVESQASPSQAALGLAEPPAEGGRVIVLPAEGDGSGEGERAHVVTLRFESDTLGTVELRVGLDDALVHVLAAFADGPPLALARASAGALRDALAVAAARPAEVELVRRPDPLDVYV